LTFFDEIERIFENGVAFISAMPTTIEHGDRVWRFQDGGDDKSL
jgi:hypothetical protein